LGSSYTAFTDRWFSSMQKGNHPAAKEYAPRPGADTEIHEKLKDVSLTVDAAEYFGCDKPVVVPVGVELPPKAKAIYKEMEEKLFAELENGEVEAANAAARTAKCLQIASGAVYVTGEDGEATREWERIHDVKLDALDSIIEELAGAPLLVAYQYKHDLARILKRFPQAQEFKKGNRGNAQVEEWNNGNIPILCVHPASAGHGLNLQDGGHHLAFMSDTWNYEHYAQIVERIGPVRQMQAGHPRPVFIYLIQANGTLDAVLAARREDKRSVQDLLMDYMKKKAP
jgi:SNF2 family DNA or RNA helicase